VGFETLREGMLRGMAGIDGPEALLVAICRTYVHLGLENPALYRLMFGAVLSDAGTRDRPMVARTAGIHARALLEEVILHGARSGVFAASPDNPQDLALTTLAVWSAVHGLVMLVLDKLAQPGLTVDDMIAKVLRMVAAGLVNTRVRSSALTPTA
jgi:hypothetical protein